MIHFQRTAMFKFIAGIVTTVPMKYLNAILFNIMSPLVREMTTTEETNAELRRLAKEIATMIKKSVGNEEYVKLLNRVQQRLDIRKAERRKVRAQQVNLFSSFYILINFYIYIYELIEFYEILKRIYTLFFLFSSL